MINKIAKGGGGTRILQEFSTFQYVFGQWMELGYFIIRWSVLHLNAECLKLSLV